MTSYHEEMAFKKCNFWQISLLSYLTVNESNVNSIGKIKPSLKAVIEKISEGMHSKNICNFPVKELCKHDNKNWLLDTYRQILKMNRFISWIYKELIVLQKYVVWKMLIDGNKKSNEKLSQKT